MASRINWEEQLSVISDGVSDEFSRALSLISREGLKWIELQVIDGRSVGDMSGREIGELKRRIADEGLATCCVSPKNLFGGLSASETSRLDAGYLKQMDLLDRVFDHALALEARSVRIMNFRKEMVLFGAFGVAGAVVSRGSWDRLVDLMRPPAERAEKAGIQLVTETCMKGMITSARLARMLVDAVSIPALKILWDPCNAMFFNERPFPEGFGELKGGFIGHVHIKDANMDIPGARVDFTEVGGGQLGQYLECIVEALSLDGYKGFVSLENVYRPSVDGSEAAFKISIDRLRRAFNAGARGA